MKITLRRKYAFSESNNLGDENLQKLSTDHHYQLDKKFTLEIKLQAT